MAWKLYTDNGAEQIYVNGDLKVSIVHPEITIYPYVLQVWRDGNIGYEVRAKDTVSLIRTYDTIKHFEKRGYQLETCWEHEVKVMHVTEQDAPIVVLYPVPYTDTEHVYQFPR